MSSSLPRSIQELILQFQKLPGIGPKTAARLAYFYVNTSSRVAQEMVTALQKVKTDLRVCSRCFTITEDDPCEICQSTERAENILCVVEAPLDIVALEQSKAYNGKYFVLAGLISPLKGISAEDIRVSELQSRLKELLLKHDRLELIFALNPSMEGETTILYIKELLKGIKGATERITLTRLALGLPTGADIDYADETTLQRALEGRSAL